MESSLHKEWKDWLQNNCTNGKENLVIYIANGGQDMLYQPNPETKAAIIHMQKMNNFHGYTKNDRCVGLLIGSPGCGKTRCLVEIKNHIYKM